MNWAAVEAVGTVAASILAFWAWRTGQETLRLSYRPVIRPVPTRTLNVIKLKNIGNGPAVAVMAVLAAKPESIVGSLQVVERLGERGETGEGNRVGNVTMLIHGDDFEMLLVGRRFRLLYQDIAGTWHETAFDVMEQRQFKIKYVGPKHWWHFRTQVPNAVRQRGHFAEADELV